MAAAVRDSCLNAPCWSGAFETSVGVLPEGQGEVCHKSVALSDQEGAVSPAALHAEVLNQPLGHQPAFLHAAMEPGFCKLLWRVFLRPQ